MESPRQRAERVCGLIREKSLGRVTATFQLEHEIRDAVQAERDRIVDQLERHQFQVGTPAFGARLFLTVALLFHPRTFFRSCSDAIKNLLVAHVKRNS